MTLESLVPKVDLYAVKVFNSAEKDLYRTLFATAVVH